MSRIDEPPPSKAPFGGGLASAVLQAALLQVSAALAETLEPTALAHLVATHARALLRADAAGVFVWDPGAGVMQALYADDAPANEPIRPDEGVVGLAFQLERPVVVHDYPGSARAIAWAVEAGTRTAAAVPLRVDGRPLGVLAVRNPRAAPDPDVCGEVLTLLAALLAAGLDVARLGREVRQQRHLSAEDSARLTAILDRVPSGVVVVNGRGHVVLANAAAYHLAGPASDAGRQRPPPPLAIQWREPRSHRVLLPPEAPTARVLAGETIERAELVVWHPKRHLDVWLRVDGTPLRDARGRVTGAVLVYTDVTQEHTLRRDLTATAVEHARLLGQMAERTARVAALAEQLVGGRTEPADSAATVPVQGLSPRDRHILRLVARGLTNREIGAAVHLSAGTVANRVGHLVETLGATDRTHAAVLALLSDLLDTP